MLTVELGEGWEAVARNDVFYWRREKGSLGTKAISDHKTLFCDLYCFWWIIVVFLWNIFQLTILINKKDSVAKTTEVAAVKFVHSPAAGKPSAWLPKSAPRTGAVVTAGPDGRKEWSGSHRPAGKAAWCQWAVVRLVWEKAWMSV